MRIVFYVGKAQEKGEVEGAETDWKKQRERKEQTMYDRDAKGVW